MGGMDFEKARLKQYCRYKRTRLGVYGEVAGVEWIARQLFVIYLGLCFYGGTKFRQTTRFMPEATISHNNHEVYEA